MNLQYQQSKLRFGLFVILVSLSSLTGCAAQQVSTDDMLSFQTNCSKKDEQIKFLDSVQYNGLDRIWAGLQLVFLGPLTPDYRTKIDIANGSAQYWIQGVKEDVMRCAA